MDVIIKVFTGTYVILLLVFASLGIISANIDSRNAVEFASLVDTTIKESNYDQDTIDKLIQDAENRGYELTVSTYAGSNSRVTHGYATLTYTFEVPIFGIKQYHHIDRDI